MSIVANTRMMRRALSLLAGGLLAVMPLQAQTHRMSLEGRLGSTIPVSSLARAGAESGLLVEGELIYTPSVNFSVFGGAGLHSFNCNGDEDCDPFSSRGLHGGVKYLFHHSGTATPWLRAGLLLHEAERGREDSGLALGFEGGGGIDLALTPRFSLSPALRLHRFTADFGNERLDMSWLSLALGAHFHF